MCRNDLSAGVGAPETIENETTVGERRAVVIMFNHGLCVFFLVYFLYIPCIFLVYSLYIPCVFLFITVLHALVCCRVFTSSTQFAAWEALLNETEQEAKVCVIYLLCA